MVYMQTPALIRRKTHMRIPPKKVPRRRLCAAIFDMDGVIADNMGYHTKAWELFIRKYAPQLVIGDVTPHYGKTNADLMGYVFGRRLTASEVEEYGEEKERFYRELYAADMAPLPGLVKFLEELRADGLHAVVATSAPKSNVDFLLDGLKIRPLFDAVVDAGHVTRGKPDPEIYLKAASRVGCRPEDCVVFEDAAAGIEAGRRARMMVVGVATTLSSENLTGTALVIKDFREVNVARLNEVLKSATR
jgi:beta-phosphoglucomutase